MRDKENHLIRIIGENNHHLLTVGMSGQGKTYFLCRQIEIALEENQNVFILDYSGSFTQYELQKQKFMYPSQEYNIKEEKFVWWMERDTMAQNLFGSLKEAMNIASYFQEMILRQVVDKIVNSSQKFSVLDLIDELEKVLAQCKESKTSEDITMNVIRLLSKIEPYRDLNNIIFQSVESIEYMMYPKLTILQLTYFGELQRKFLTKLLLTVYWSDIYMQKHRNQYDVVVLDEFQWLKIEENSLLGNMLREGRKKGIALLLSTQFITHYGGEELASLLQVENLVVFKQVNRECRMMASIIDLNNTRKWETIISQLNRGEAIIKGKYVLEGYPNIFDTPLIVKI